MEQCDEIETEVNFKVHAEDYQRTQLDRYHHFLPFRFPKPPSSQPSDLTHVPPRLVMVKLTELILRLTGQWTADEKGEGLVDDF